MRNAHNHLAVDGLDRRAERDDSEHTYLEQIAQRNTSSGTHSSISTALIKLRRP